MKSKTVGIWMDHSEANLIDPNTLDNNHSIVSNFTFSDKEEVLSRSESSMHNKENQEHEAYYKEIGKAILNYDHVLLFGPTHAKEELHNFLNKDLHFKDIQFDVKSADKMSDNQKNAFIHNHFDKN